MKCLIMVFARFLLSVSNPHHLLLMKISSYRNNFQTSQTAISLSTCQNACEIRLTTNQDLKLLQSWLDNSGLSIGLSAESKYSAELLNKSRINTCRIHYVEWWFFIGWRNRHRQCTATVTLQDFLSLENICFGWGNFYLNTKEILSF